MEVKNVIFACLIFACVTLNSVQAASFHYRSGREIEIPVANEINREEIVSELRKEPEVTAIETEPVAAIIREEVIVPVDQLRVVAPVIEIQEPVALVSEKEESNVVVDEVVALRSANAESIVPVVVVEKIADVPIVEAPVAVAAIEEVIPKTKNEPLVGIDENVVVPVPNLKTEEKEVPIEVAAVFVRSSPDEQQVVENVVEADSPIVETDEANRQNEAAPAAPAAPPRPSVIQAIQNNFQNFQSQIQSALNPAAANSDPAVTTTQRPGFIVQFQQAIGSVFNRPAGSAPGPIQGFVAAVQNNLSQAQSNFQGIFRPGGSSPAAVPAASPPSPVTIPVVPVVVAPVAEKTMLEEVPVVDEKIDAVQKVNEKVDEVKSD